MTHLVVLGLDNRDDAERVLDLAADPCRPGQRPGGPVAVGVGEPEAVTANDLRDAAATFSLALPHLSRFALQGDSRRTKVD